MKFTIPMGQLSEVCVKYLKANVNLLITSSPGLGKTAKIKQAVEETLGWDLLFLHGVICDPTDVKGFPFVSKDGKSATFLPAGVMHQLVTATKPTVLFIDDVGQSPQSVQAATMQVIWDRIIGDHKIPDCVRFILASNRRQDKAGVGGILSTLTDRCVPIEVTPDHEDWITEYAIPNNVDHRIVSFIKKTMGESFYEFKAASDFTKSPTARGWELVDKTLKADFNPGVRKVCLAGCIGEPRAVEFEAHLRVCDNLPNYEDILDDPDAVEMPGGPSCSHILYALAMVLARAVLANDSRFESAFRWAERMCEDGHAEQAAFMVHFIDQTDKANAKKTKTWTQAKDGHLLGTACARLIAGPIAHIFN